MKDTLLWCAQYKYTVYLYKYVIVVSFFVVSDLCDFVLVTHLVKKKKTPACHQRCIYFNNSLTTFYFFLSFKNKTQRTPPIKTRLWDWAYKGRYKNFVTPVKGFLF